MVTSKSDKKKKGWIAGALIFSGRRDPTWNVDEDFTKNIRTIWNSLKPGEGRIAHVPSLGYRGCFVRDDRNNEYWACGGFVIFRSADSEETREDKEHQLERLILKSAPKGVVPDSLLKTL